MPTLSAAFLRTISEKADCSSTSVEVVAKGYALPIREMDNFTAKTNLLREIAEVAVLYGARHQVSEMVYRECREVMFQKFAHLGISEIREAYRAYSCGELETKKGEMWGGEFNVANFTAIVAAYSERRKRILAAYTNELHEARKADREEKRNARGKEWFEANFDAILADVASKAQSWDDAPEYLYHVCKAKGMIKIDAQEAAQVLQAAFAALKAIKADERINLFKSAALPNNVTDDERAKTIARKMVLFEKVLINMK